MDKKEMQKLDTWLAEKVMGWEKRLAHFHPGGQTNSEFWFDGDERQLSILSWHPTTDIAQAFEVVEKMRKEGYSFDAGCPYENENDWWAQFTSDYFVQAETLPLAICLSAKKAREAK